MNPKKQPATENTEFTEENPGRCGSGDPLSGNAFVHHA